jgi:hypothetical protein
MNCAIDQTDATVVISSIVTDGAKFAPVPSTAIMAIALFTPRPRFPPLAVAYRTLFPPGFVNVNEKFPLESVVPEPTELGPLEFAENTVTEAPTTGSVAPATVPENVAVAAIAGVHATPAVIAPTSTSARRNRPSFRITYFLLSAERASTPIPRTSQFGVARVLVQWETESYVRTGSPLLSYFFPDNDAGAAPITSNFA